MKKPVFLFIALLSMNLSMAKNEKQESSLSFEDYTVCGDYATAIATYAELAYGADYYTTWFNAYGECIENYY